MTESTAGPAPRLRVSVRAAGGLVIRRGEDGDLRVLLVHRPRYDDWSFPKGKLRRGESQLAAALREVREETGFPLERNRARLCAVLDSRDLVDDRSLG